MRPLCSDSGYPAVWNFGLGKRSIRVGTSATALTTAQLAQIVYRTAEGKEIPVTIDANGYLAGPNPGFMLMVR